jgi:AraC-like DNA-binding protein
LEELAQAANFSPIYFHKLFKSITGHSPAEYLLQFRITKAQELLAATDLPLCDIALQCGFTSQSYFNYVFRREKQCTPAEYRKRQIQKYFKE